MLAWAYVSCNSIIMYAKDISRDAIVLMFKTWLYLILMSEITSEKMASINRILLCCDCCYIVIYKAKKPRWAGISFSGHWNKSRTDTLVWEHSGKVIIVLKCPF